jgi:hypothetical protein
VLNLERLFEIVRDYLAIVADLELIEVLDKLYLDSPYPGDLGLVASGKSALENDETFHALARGVH